MAPISITAPLDADAEDRRTRDGEYLLLVRLALPAPGGARGRPMVVRAIKRYGTGPAAAIACRSRSRQLRRGVRVTLTGDGMSWVRGVAELAEVHDLQTPDLVTPMHGAVER